MENMRLTLDEETFILDDGGGYLGRAPPGGGGGGPPGLIPRPRPLILMQVNFYDLVLLPQRLKPEWVQQAATRLEYWDFGESAEAEIHRNRLSTENQQILRSSLFSLQIMNEAFLILSECLWICQLIFFQCLWDWRGTYDFSRVTQRTFLSGSAILC